MTRILQQLGGDGSRNPPRAGYHKGGVKVVLGSNFYDGDPGAMRRQQAAIDAVTSLSGAIPINLQWKDAVCERPAMETVAALEHDAQSVLGVPARRKPIMRELFDALAVAAEERGCRYFAFYNADIVISQAAV